MSLYNNTLVHLHTGEYQSRGIIVSQGFGRVRSCHHCFQMCTDNVRRELKANFTPTMYMNLSIMLTIMLVADDQLAMQTSEEGLQISVQLLYKICNKYCKNVS
jgi:hypothetical protein